MISFAAVADAVRTSLGPRGMDKMVGFERFLISFDCFLIQPYQNKVCYI